LFQRLNVEQGITIVFVTHNIETADYCHRVVHVRDGVVERDVRHQPRAGIYRDLVPEGMAAAVEAARAPLDSPPATQPAPAGNHGTPAAAPDPATEPAPPAAPVRRSFLPFGARKTAAGKEDGA
jgi:energy-coupling factor transporter ATP-binding protein EcfA2